MHDAAGLDRAHVWAPRAPGMYFPRRVGWTEGDYFGVEMIERHEKALREDEKRRRFPSLDSGGKVARWQILRRSIAEP